MTPNWRAALWVVVLVAAACAPSATPTPAPTQALIPPTVTDTPSPVPPTPTPSGLSASEPLTPTAAGASVAIPAGAQPLVAMARNDLARRLDLDSGDVQVLRLEASVWQTVDMGCGDDPTPLAGSEAVTGYRVVLFAGNASYEYHTDGVARVRLCSREGATEEADETRLLLADPVAAELVALAQRMLSQQLDLPVRRIRLVDVIPVVWTDTSLGCPQPDVVYAETTVDGYRLVLAAGDDEYVFHSDFDRITPCAVDDEVPSFEATPETTPEASAEAADEATPEATLEATETRSPSPSPTRP